MKKEGFVSGANRARFSGIKKRHFPVFIFKVSVKPFQNNSCKNVSFLSRFMVRSLFCYKKMAKCDKVAKAFFCQTFFKCDFM